MENNWLAGGIVIAVTGGCLIVAALVIALRGLENRDRQVPDARPLEH